MSNWKVPRISGEPIELSVNNGDQLYIVGANGSGKSALIQKFVSEYPHQNIKRITAHRQTWFESGSIDLTPANRQNYEQQYLSFYRNHQSRWKEFNSILNLNVALFDLIAKENKRARAVTYQVDNQVHEKVKDIDVDSASPLTQINELFSICSLSVKIHDDFDDWNILAKHSQGDTFNIAEMSDGERSAMIIAAHVITAEPETVFLIDEPEKHLHRSISEPFLTALFNLRKDCAFIISTHDIDLAIANPEAQVLMLRSCKWNDDKCVAWDAELLKPNSQLPETAGLTEELKRAILGDRKEILFVEGDSDSLDIQLYDVLFPDFFLIPKGNCENVINAVLGLGKSQEFHNVEVFGLIDGDNREKKEIDKLAESGIFALEVYSVESLYYCSEVITAVTHYQAELWGEDDPNELITLVQKEAIEVLEDDNLAARMAARRCERQVQESFWAEVPNWKSIMTTSTKPTSVNINIAPYLKELNLFKKFVENKKIDSLIARYPLRDSEVFETIVKTLKCESQDYYQHIVLKLVKENEKIAKCIKKRIGRLSDALNK